MISGLRVNYWGKPTSRTDMARQGKCFECVLQGEVVRLPRGPKRPIVFYAFMCVCHGVFMRSG